MRAFFKQLFPYFSAFVIIHTILRVTLLARSINEAGMTGYEILQIFVRGYWFDIVTSGFVLIPIALIFLFVRNSFWLKKSGYITQFILRFVFLYSVCFGFVSEYLFWTEFTTRFNFIAVDYLVYTNEVIGNIQESYPLPTIFSIIAILSFVITYFSLRKNKVAILPKIGKRFQAFAIYILLVISLYSISNIEQAQVDDNAEVTELAANGVYNLFYAFWNNEINYESFYAEHKKTQVEAGMRKLLYERDSKYESESGLIRIVKPPRPEKHKNVIIVVMESMSASYMGAFGDTNNLTPSLDKLAKEGLLFTKTYATGTRTVRGLEAVTLSVPPTPGQSIVRRPNNSNLFSLGFIFKDRGYDTKFIYGGYGYFDNMNEFFRGNGFDIIDRTVLNDDEIHFANIWGVADDDMFRHAIREADKSYAAKKPFMSLIMTTSNHRPYTYPDGKIDIPSKSGRLGGVKYADYSVGKLIEEAKTKPWFKDTIFVFVADHTAGAGGKAELDPAKYHIPMIFYAPEIVKPARFEAISSQIDLGPTLLGMLDFHYRTKFYGEDLLNDKDEVPHAFISNFQKVALVRDGELTVLAPKQQIRQFDWESQKAEKDSNEVLVDDTIYYYQSASWWHENYQRIKTTLDK